MYRGVLQLYESLAAERANPNIASQSLYRIGIIKFEKLFDLDGALSAFDQIKNLSQIVNISYDALLKIGEVQTTRNDLAKARSEYE